MPLPQRETALHFTSARGAICVLRGRGWSGYGGGSSAAKVTLAGRRLLALLPLSERQYLWKSSGCDGTPPAAASMAARS